MNNTYMVIVNDATMALLSQLIPTLQFVHIHGSLATGNDKFQYIVSPLQPTQPQETPVDNIVEDNAPPPVENVE